MNWEQLTSIEQLDQIDQLSKELPVVLFKHSTRCSISSASLDRIERKWNANNHPGVKAYYLDLIANRSISSAVAEHYNIEHESPQLLVIEDGKCTFDLSHFSISYDAVLDKIAPVSI